MQDPTSSFAAGEIVAGRFKIIRLLAEGGGGEVYEAEDLELREAVAVKTLRGEIAANEEAIQRFKREILLARKVTHRNVCRTFDVFHHRKHDQSTGQERDISFLTMELLRGQTLAEYLGGKGPMTTAQALPIARQMADALSAAHSAGVIHRDFKSSNVVLVPSPEEEGGFHVVVTDFGLAYSNLASKSDAPHLTRAEAIIGTPAYMAPEQAEGKEVTAAADIYALGVVLFEMVTGTQPFAGESLISTILMKVKEPAPSPRNLVSHLDLTWEQVILRCLERDPMDRFANATEVVMALRGEAAISPRPVKKKGVEWRTRLIPIALLLLLALGFVLFRMHSASPPPMASTGRRSVAVLGFRNLSGRHDAAWLSTALAEMLTTELSAGEKLRTIPGEDVARMKIELSLPDADSLAGDTLSRIRANLGTDFVVLGSYLALGKEAGGRIRLDLRLQDAQLGETVATVGQTGTEAQIFDLVSKAGAELREKLGVGDLSAAQQGEILVSRPSSPEAVRFYSEGLAELRSFNALKARDLLQRTVSADAKFPLAHSALAEAWSKLGYDGKAKDEAKEALDLSANLPRTERLSIEGRYREMAGEYDKALEIYRTLFESYPDNLDYGLRLASAQISAGKVEALATLSALRKLPSPTSEDPRIDLAEAEIQQFQADFKAEHVVAQRAIDKGRALSEWLLVGRALQFDGWAQFKLGNHKEAERSWDEAAKIFSAGGDRGGLAWVYRRTGFLYSDQGKLEQSRSMYDQSLAIAREIGDKKMESEILSGLAVVLYNRGNLTAAQEKLEKAIEARTEAGDRVYRSTLLNNMGLILREMGKLSQAKDTLNEAIVFARQNASTTNIGYPLYNLGEVYLAQGELASAKKSFDESYKVLSEKGEKRGTAYALYGLAQVSAAQGNLTDAREKQEESLAIRSQIHDRWVSCRNQIMLASLAGEQDRAAEAETLAASAVEESRRQKAEGNEAWALTALAQASLAQGKRAQAQEAIGNALAINTQNLAVQVAMNITAARIDAASGEPAGLEKARNRLRDAMSKALNANLLGLQFEVRLAMGEINKDAGETESARSILRSLEEEAKAKGFLLIARKAAAVKSK